MVNSFWKIFGVAVVLAQAGCAYVSAPVGESVERRLLARKMSDAEFGGEITDAGKSIRFGVFEGSIPIAPVTVPMVESYRDLPGLSVRLNGRHAVQMLAD